MAIQTRTSRVFTISFPDALARQVEEIAQEESRNISELFREAFRAYKFQLYERKLANLRPKPSVSTSEIGQDQVEAWVDEIRSEDHTRRRPQK